MAFWRDATKNDPKRQHRWLFQLGSSDGRVNDFTSEISYICKKVTRPSIEVNSAEHKFLNHTFYYPGNVTYEACSVTLVDPTTPDSAANLHKLLQLGGYVLPGNIQNNVGDGHAQAGTTSKKKSIAAINDTAIIRMIDADGKDQEVIFLKNVWIQKVDFGGDLAYDSDDLMEITMDLRYDWFEMQSLVDGGDTNLGPIPS